MRVLFDGFWWSNGPESNRQVMRAFILAWADSFPEDELTVAVPRAAVAVARSELPERVAVIGTRLRPQGVSAILELPFVSRRIRADVTVSHNFTPAFGASAVFIHDYMFLTSPEWFTARERAYFALMPASAHRARWVFTSSRTEADRISRLSRHRAVVPVGLAIGTGLRGAVPRRPTGIAPDLHDFLLCVGRLNARKNLASTIDAALRSGRVTAESPLLVVGEPQGRRAELTDEVDAAVRAGLVRFLGFIDDAGLAWLYGNASLLLFFTRDEGFGLPALEARHFGAPVAVSDIAVFREIHGAEAVYASPDDVPAMAEAIRRAPRRAAAAAQGDLGYSWPASVATMRGVIALSLEAGASRGARR